MGEGAKMPGLAYQMIEINVFFPPVLQYVIDEGLVNSQPIHGYGSPLC